MTSKGSGCADIARSSRDRLADAKTYRLVGVTRAFY
jgi:hypothetical protein